MPNEDAAGNGRIRWRGQLHLPTHFAGFAMPMPNPARIEPLARLASVLATGPKLRAATAEMDVSDAAVVDEARSFDLSGASELARQLGQRPDGPPATSSAATQIKRRRPDPAIYSPTTPTQTALVTP